MLKNCFDFVFFGDTSAHVFLSLFLQNFFI